MEPTRFTPNIFSFFFLELEYHSCTDSLEHVLPCYDMYLNVLRPHFLSVGLHFTSWNCNDGVFETGFTAIAWMNCPRPHRLHILKHPDLIYVHHIIALNNVLKSKGHQPRLQTGELNYIKFQQQDINLAFKLVKFILNFNIDRHPVY